jgi:hypothetical protein
MNLCDTVSKYYIWWTKVRNTRNYELVNQVVLHQTVAYRMLTRTPETHKAAFN